MFTCLSIFLFILDSLLLEMEVENLKENQEMILVRLAAIEQFIRDGQEQQTKGGHSPPALPQASSEQVFRE